MVTTIQIDEKTLMLLKKLKEELKKYLEAQKNGMVYESGISVKQAQRGAKYLALMHPNRCKYWHCDYCQVYGHSLSTPNECFMKLKTKEERVAAALKIMEEDIENEVQSSSTKGK